MQGATGVSRSERVLRACEGCGAPFTPVRPHQRHCRPSCRKLTFERRQAARLARRTTTSRTPCLFE